MTATAPAFPRYQPGTEQPPCPLRGHHHPTTHVAWHTRPAIDDQRAETVACPTGRARWFCVEGIAPNRYNRTR